MTTTRVYRYNQDRWEYRDTSVSSTSGNTYVDYYRQAQPSEPTEEGRDSGYYQSMQGNW